MGLFSRLGKSLIKIQVDAISGIEYVNENEIDAKVENFLLHYKHFLKNVYSVDDKIEIVTAFIITAIGVAKSDGTFSDNEVTSLLDFMEGSLEGEMSREESLEIIRDLNKMPLDMEVLGNIAIDIKKKHGESAIATLKSFIEFIIYSDGEVHPKELEFLERWNETINILKTHL